MTPEMLTEGLKLLVTVSSVFGGMKVALNGLKSDVGEIKGNVAKIAERVGEHGERLAVLEDRGDRRSA